jgi:ATP-binding cassette subfamily B protein
MHPAWTHCWPGFPFPPPLPACQTDLLDEQIGGETISSGWLIRLPPSGNLWEQLHRAGTGRALLIGVSSYVLSLGFTLAAWAVLGRSALNGQFSAATFGLWALLLLAVLPLQMTLSRVVGWVSVHAGALLKQRLLFGITRLQPDQRRHAGAGNFFGQALDGEYVEQLTLTGGISALLALFQIATAGAVLAWSGNSLQAAACSPSGWGSSCCSAWRYLSWPSHLPISPAK